MPEPKGQMLFVNLAASQVRRRLKGFGHGVRKVQSAGRGRAAIVHTATGRHLRELQALFADAGCAIRERELSEPIESLPNLGPASGAWLRAAGIRSIADLKALGPAAAFAIVRRHEPKAGLNLLWALAAGLQGTDWRKLTEGEKARLREQWPELDAGL